MIIATNNTEVIIVLEPENLERLKKFEKITKVIDGRVVTIRYCPDVQYVDGLIAHGIGLNDALELSRDRKPVFDRPKVPIKTLYSVKKTTEDGGHA